MLYLTDMEFTSLVNLPVAPNSSRAKLSKAMGRKKVNDVWPHPLTSL